MQMFSDINILIKLYALDDDKSPSQRYSKAEKLFLKIRRIFHIISVGFLAYKYQYTMSGQPMLLTAYVAKFKQQFSEQIFSSTKIKKFAIFLNITWILLITFNFMGRYLFRILRFANECDITHCIYDIYVDSSIVLIFWSIYIYGWVTASI